ncbi:MAG: transcription termination/antitermination protein NusA [Lactobacillales bacterium]|nr:transcription termination/antitermination protein NusA [Lactobacillales bacterium]
MNSKEFKKAVDLLVKEKGIDPEVIYEAMELALTSAYKKNYNSLSNVRVDINRDTGDIKVYSFKTVVDRAEEDKYKNFADIDFSTINEDDEEAEDEPVLPFVYDEKIHLTLEEAQKIVPDIKIGETIEEEVTPKDFGRVAASTAKQVVVQKIREAERNVIIEEFADKQDELATGIVEMEDERNYYINLGRTQGILSKSEIIPGEQIKMGSSIKVYITKVENNSKGPLILLSRTHYGFVKRLFELEIPEINEGIILVYSVARDAGNRTKIAVYSEDPNVDPVGSCIGERGTRIANILNELGGEKVDIIPYDKDATKFVENALSPAKNLHVFITNEEKKEAYVIVDDENLSLAIGKKGLNVRLAARLTHYKIDVKSYDQARADGINILGD